MRLALLLLIAASVCSPQALNAVRKIYIDPMPDNLDQYIRAEVVKQKAKFTIVLAEADADAILSGASEAQKGTGAQITGRYLGLNDTASASLSLISKDRKTLLWAGEAGDRSMMWGPLARGGPRKVASRLVGQLKKAMK